MPFHPLTIKQITDETPDAYTVLFEKPEMDKFQAYLPGQYLTFKLTVDGEEIRRAFSLSSSPYADEHLSVTIKRVPGGKASNFIRDELKAGDLLESLPPLGNFTVDPDPGRSRHYILIGGGSGITPLMSILKSVLAEERTSKVSLWYGNRNEASIIFKEELQQLRRQYDGRLYVYHTLSQPEASWEGFTGRLNKERIYDLISELFMEDEYRKQYYICGPQGLMEGAEAALEKHAVNPPDIHREYYNSPVPTEAEAEAAAEETADNGLNLILARVGEAEADTEIKPHTVTVELEGQSHELEVSPEEAILDAGISAQLDPPYSCQSGICTTCKAKLKQGVVGMDTAMGLSDEEIEAGFILTCQSHPLSEGVQLSYDEVD